MTQESSKSTGNQPFTHTLSDSGTFKSSPVCSLNICKHTDKPWFTSSALIFYAKLYCHMISEHILFLSLLKFYKTSTYSWRYSKFKALSCNLAYTCITKTLCPKSWEVLMTFSYSFTMSCHQIFSFFFKTNMSHFILLKCWWI